MLSNIDITESFDVIKRSAVWKCDHYKQTVHVLREDDGRYFTVLDQNLKVFLESRFQKDKNVYFTTTWNELT